jgi:predicted AAA+ superfamily ATPase
MNTFSRTIFPAPKDALTDRRSSGLATISEGAAFENAICNLLRPYDRLNYLAKSSEYEIDFILSRGNELVGLEVKYHPSNPMTRN